MDTANPYTARLLATIPSRVGQSVLYSLSEHDAKEIVAKRLSAGVGTKTGNQPREGDVYPGIVIRDWCNYPAVPDYAAGKITDGAGRVISAAEFIADSSCNLQIFLDGNDSYWATSRTQYQPEKHPDPRGHFSV